MEKNLKKTGRNHKSLTSGLSAPKSAALIGTGAVTLFGVAVAGTAAFLIWKNREKIMSLADQYIGLPESWKEKDRNVTDTDFGVPYRNRNRDAMDDASSSSAV